MVESLSERHLGPCDFDRARVVLGVQVANEVSFLSPPRSVALEPSLDNGLIESLRTRHGCVMSSGTTAASNSSALKKPKLKAASRSVVRSLCAFFATLAALS